MSRRTLFKLSNVRSGVMMRLDGRFENIFQGDFNPHEARV